MQQRYYEPLAGRFLSVDPVVTDWDSGSSFNRYVYAYNNPYHYVDPDGRAGIGAVLVGGAVVCSRIAACRAAGLALAAATGKAISGVLQSTSGSEEPKVDGEGASPEEIANSSGGETAGERVSGPERDKILEEDQNADQSWTCWRCDGKIWDRSKVHIGHRNVPRSKGGNKHPDNLRCEGESCNTSAGNRGRVKPGSDCRSKGNCGQPPKRQDPSKLPDPK